MHSQASKARSVPNDFRAAMTAATQDSQAGQQDYGADLDRLINGAAVHEQDTVNSRNLSNILHNIRDYGPAGGDKARRKRAPVAAADNSTRARADSASASTETDAQVNARLAATLNKQQPRTRRSPWLQSAALLVLLALVAALALMQYRTEENLSQLSADLGSGTLAAGTEGVQNMAQLESAIIDLSSKLNRIDARLDVLATNDMTDARIVSLIKTEIAPRLEAIRASEQAITATASELQPAVKTESPVSQQTDKPVTTTASAAVVQDQPAITRAIPAEPAATVVPTAAENWVVNLASFAERSKATRAYDKLKQASVYAMIHETSVNGKTVYRLSVDGFSTRAAAADFIDNTARQQGFANGWIRRG